MEIGQVDQEPQRRSFYNICTGGQETQERVLVLSSLLSPFTFV